MTNKDLEDAYEMGFRAALAIDEYVADIDDYVETQEYVDQRRSDLKELLSFDRGL